MSAQVPTESSAGSPGESLPRRLLHLVYAHNPFYLLSVGFVVHGASYWMQTSGGYRTWPLIALVSGYIVLLAGVAWAIVRLGQVWDDARSILLILLLMFVELSLTLDDPLLTAPRLGVAAVVGSFLFVVLISEGLLYGLRIRLGRRFRIPLYLLLGLMMLFPLALSARLFDLTPEQISWRIYWFFPLVGSAMLTLVPAIRKGPAYTEDSGTPWRWPWYPWTLFGGVLLGVCLRGYALSLSFDPVLSVGTEAAMRLETAWGLYFLAPVVLALGWLLLEFGLAGNRAKLQQFALLIPLLAVGLSLPIWNISAPFADFLEMFTLRFGSPVFVALLGSLVFYAGAFLRRVPASEVGFALALCLLAVVGPKTLNFTPTLVPNTLPLKLAAVVLVVRGCAHSQSLSALGGCVFGIAALQAELPAEWPGFWQNALILHLIGLAVLLVGVSFEDRLAAALRGATAVLLLGGSAFALFGTAYLPADLSSAIQTGYVAGLIGLALGLAYSLGSRWHLAAGGLSLGLGGAVLLREAYSWLRTLPEWPAILSFGLAFLLLAVGGAISALKAGAGNRLKTCLPRKSLEGPAES